MICKTYQLLQVIGLFFLEFCGSHFSITNQTFSENIFLELNNNCTYNSALLDIIMSGFNSTLHRYNIIFQKCMLRFLQPYLCQFLLHAKVAKEARHSDVCDVMVTSSLVSMYNKLQIWIRNYLKFLLVPNTSVVSKKKL